MLKSQEYGLAVDDVLQPFRSVMILEDDGLLSLMLEDLVRGEGLAEVHVCRDVKGALEVVEAAALDCAILDVSLHHGPNYDVADALAARGIPFMFCTGLSLNDIVERHRHRPILPKPYGDAEFKAAFAAALSG